MLFTVLIRPAEEGGYWTEVPALPGCFSQGETTEEALANTREAIEVHVAAMREEGLVLLQRGFDDHAVNLTLELFLRMLRDFFGDRLVSVIMYGSLCFDDLAPGYGDLDFLAVIEDDLSEDDCSRLVELRKPLRSGTYGVHSQMIEGAFLPRKMLDPAIAGEAFWWGTSGDRKWEENKLGWLVLHVIRERGIVIFGEDVRTEIPAAKDNDLLDDVKAYCKSVEQHGRGGDLHSVDWLLTSARLLLWVKERRLSSKSEAADWGFANAEGAWRERLPKAKELRLNPMLAEEPAALAWLNALDASIQESRNELERAFASPH